MSQFPTWVAVMLVVLSVFNAGAVVLYLLQRRHKKQDDKHETDSQNEIVRAETDTKFRADLLNRVASLEKEQKEAHYKNLKDTADKVRIETENKQLREQNARQEIEIEKLRLENKTLKNEVSDLRLRLGTIQNELGLVTIQSNRLFTQVQELLHSKDVAIEKEVLRRLGAIRNKKSPIVVIDTDVSTVESFKEAFTNYKLDYAIFSNGDGFLEWMRENTVSIIIVDLTLREEMDGVTLIEKIRSYERRNDQPPSRIFVYSGYEVSYAIRIDLESYNVEAILKKIQYTAVDICTMILSQLSEDKQSVGHDI